MSHIDPSAAPRYRLAPSDSERLREILADVPPATGACQGESRAHRVRRRRRWPWALLAAGFLLVVVGLALATVSPQVEDIARGVLSTLGADPDAVLAGVSRILQAATESMHALADRATEMIDEILEQFSNGKANHQD